MFLKHFSSLSKTNKFLLSLLIMIITLIISLSVMIVVELANNNNPEIAIAESMVNNLYQDADHIHLIDSISETQINDVLLKTEKMNGRKAKALYSLVLQAQKKFLTTQEIASLFGLSEHEHILDLSTDDLKLSLEANTTVISSAEENLSKLPQDLLKQELSVYLEYAKTTNQLIENSKKAIESFNTSFDNEEDFPALFSDIDSLEAIISPVRTQYHFSELQEQLKQKLSSIRDRVEIMIDEEMLSEENKDIILSKPILYDLLTGTAINPKKLASLTFDDGPNEEFTTQVLDVLNKYGVQGTFFVMGAYVDDYPHVAKRIVDEGHIIANHSYSHPNFDVETDETVKQQIEWAQESIFDATGVTPTLYRLPFGAGGARVVKLLKPLKSIIWNVDTDDWQTQDAQQIYHKTMNNLSNNSLILMHDTHQATPDALEMIIPEMLEQGYVFVAPDEVGYDFHYFENLSE